MPSAPKSIKSARSRFRFITGKFPWVTFGFGLFCAVVGGFVGYTMPH